MSKAGQEEEIRESRDLNASFSYGSETEREKTSVRKPTGTNEGEPKPTKGEKIFLLGNL